MMKRCRGFFHGLGLFCSHLFLTARVTLLSFRQRESSCAKAIRLCEAERAKRPFSFVPYLLLLNLYLGENNHWRAVQLCEDLVLLGYFSMSLAKKYANALFHLAKHRKALEVLHEAENLDPSDTWILERIGHCYFHLDHYQVARNTYQKCLELSQDTEAKKRMRNLLQQIDRLLDCT